MISVDTNVLVRALVEDPGEPRQTAAARTSLKRAKQAHVSQIVQVETVWVLESAHKLAKEQILAVLEHLRDNAAFHLQARARFETALSEYRNGSADFADYLILAESRAQGTDLLTFDKRLLKTGGTRAP